MWYWIIIVKYLFYRKLFYSDIIIWFYDVFKNIYIMIRRINMIRNCDIYFSKIFFDFFDRFMVCGKIIFC